MPKATSVIDRSDLRCTLGLASAQELKNEHPHPELLPRIKKRPPKR